MANSAAPDAPLARVIIGQAIRLLRERQGLTLEQFAAVVGVSYQYLCRIESGKQNFSIRVLEKIARGFGLSLGTLVAAAYGESLRFGFGRPLAGAMSPALVPAGDME